VLENAGPAIAGLGPLDLVMLNHAFRQIAHPHRTMQILSDSVRPNGFVMLDEGCLSNFILLERPETLRLHFFHQKAFYYTVEHFMILFARYGFRYLGAYYIQRDSDTNLAQSTLTFRHTRDTDVEPDLIERARHTSGQIYRYFRDHPSWPAR
jgi:hypothetical protein